MQYEDQIMRLSLTAHTRYMQCMCMRVFLGLKSLLDIYFANVRVFVCRLLWIGFVLCHQTKISQKRSEAKTQRMWDTKFYLSTVQHSFYGRSFAVEDFGRELVPPIRRVSRRVFHIKQP